jgi:hypothetical protein
VPRRHECRHVAQAVDVDLEQRGEGVLHRGGEENDDRHLCASQRGLPAQHSHQQQPRGGTEQPLLGEAGAAVQYQDERHPGQHHRSDYQVGSAAVP